MLHAEIRERIKDAMRSKNQVELDTLRAVLSACTNELVSLKRTPQDALTDDEVLTVIKRLVKQRKDSIEQFDAGGRPELADEERAQLAVLTPFLPAMMSEEEIRTVAQAKIAELGIADKSESGKLVGTLMKELSGKADGGDVKKVVEALLA